MTTAYSTNLGLALPVQGELSGTWGDTVNNGITQYSDIAIAGTLALTSASFTANALTLANTNGNASGTNIGNTTAQYMVLKVSSLAANVTITAPSTSKLYLVDNTDATYTVTIKASGQSGYTVPVSTRAWVYFNGTDYVLASANNRNSLNGTLSVANGGTGLTSGTSGGVLAFTASGTLASSTALAANALVIGGGAGAAPSTTTTGTGVVTAVGNAVNTTGGLVTQSGTLAANNFLLGGGSATAISSTSLLALSAAVTTGNFVKAAGYADTVTALGNTGTAINVDVTSGGVFTATLTGNCTFTLRYPVSSGASSFVLILTNDATPSRTVAFSGGTFKYPGGSVTRTTTANAVDIWFFMTPDGGTTWYVSIPMANLS